MKSRCKTCDNRGEETLVCYWHIAKPVGAIVRWWGLIGPDTWRLYAGPLVPAFRDKVNRHRNL